MSYAALNAEVVSRLRASPLLARVLDFEPTTILDSPTCYVLLDRVDRERIGGGGMVTYGVIARVCIRWSDNEQAEQEVIPLADALPDIVGATFAPFTSVFVKEITAVFVVIGGVTYRALDCYITAKEHMC